MEVPTVFLHIMMSIVAQKKQLNFHHFVTKGDGWLTLIHGSNQEGHFQWEDWRIHLCIGPKLLKSCRLKTTICVCVWVFGLTMQWVLILCLKADHHSGCYFRGIWDQGRNRNTQRMYICVHSLEKKSRNGSTHRYFSEANSLNEAGIWPVSLLKLKSLLSWDRYTQTHTHTH